MDNQKTFHYTYSAQQQEEIRAIRLKYTAQEEVKMDQLRKLDQSVTQKATRRALIIGVIGALILGLGMSLCMSELPQALGLSDHLAMGIGIFVGLVGMGLAGCSYPLYAHTIKTERERIAPEILRPTSEMMQ